MKLPESIKTLLACLVILALYAGIVLAIGCIQAKAMLPEDYELINTGRQLGVASIRTGQLHNALQRQAEQHAFNQALRHHQSHDGWDQRVATLQRQLPEITEWAEVCAESWPGQSMHDAAREMYLCWQRSAGHWRAVNGACIYYGYSMRRSDNGIWYACGIFAVKRGR